MNEKEALQNLDSVLKEWTSTPMGRRAFLASLGILLASCAQKQHRQREGDNSGQTTSMTVADEKRMTQEVLPQMKKDYPPLQNSQMQGYISNLGRKVVAASNLEGNPYNYNFTVVDVDYVNAFALPAGTVFVTAPLIAMADTEAELAGVIGHEVGHIQARHTAERMEKAKKEQNKSWMYAAGGGLLGGIVGFGLGQLVCKKGDNECLQKAATYGAAAGAGGGLLIQKYAFMANSREDEMEADRIGFRTAVKAGYDKDKVGLFYEKLLKMEQQSKGNKDPLMSALSDALSTHPPSKERVTQMQQMASEQARTIKMIESTKDFENIQKLVKKHLETKKRS
ncbi:MAG: M48 family metalloprotease [Bdellovibrionia bacterium]